MLLGTLGTLGATLLGYLLVGKGMTAKRRGQGVKSQGQGSTRIGQNI